MEERESETLIILFNIGNNEVLQCVDNEKIIHAINTAIIWNRENNEKNEHNFVGLTLAPEEAWMWDENKVKKFLIEQREWGQVTVITNGWDIR